MNRYFIKKKITAFLFCICIIVYAVLSFTTLSSKVLAFIEDESITSPQDVATSIDGIINENVYERYAFIEGYGALQNLLAKDEINNMEVIRGEQNILYYQEYLKEPKDVEEIVSRIQALSAFEEQQGTQTMVLLTPDKYIRGKSQLPMGAPYNYANESADAYVKSLQEAQIPVLDFRIELETNDIPIEDLVYATDHHWRIETAYLAFVSLVKDLNQRYGLSLDPQGEAVNIDHYNQIVYEQSFLGSQGRKTGVAYSGLDDFTYLYPKFATSFQYEWSYQGTTFTKQGRFEQALTNPLYLQEPAGYEPINDKYTAYLDGNAGVARIHNDLVDNDVKVLFIKDSYTLPLAAFFATVCEDVELLDPRYYDGDIEDYVKENTYTHVFVSMSAQSLDPSFFPFFERE